MMENHLVFIIIIIIIIIVLFPMNTQHCNVTLVIIVNDMVQFHEIYPLDMHFRLKKQKQIINQAILCQAKAVIVWFVTVGRCHCTWSMPMR